MKKIRVLAILSVFICLMLSGCSILNLRPHNESADKLQWVLSDIDARQFTFDENTYIISSVTASTEELGKRIGAIGQLAYINGCTSNVEGSV